MGKVQIPFGTAVFLIFTTLQANPVETSTQTAT